MNRGIRTPCKPPFFAEQSLPAIDSDGQHSTSKISRIPGHAILIDEAGVNVRKFLHQELSVARLNDIHDHLWMTGRRGNLHPLHWQRMTKRDIVVTEDPAMHLLWYDSTIFIKPLPICLLDYDFFSSYICPDRDIFRQACGFLRTYALLIKHESDFRIAVDLGLLPKTVSWLQWSDLAHTLTAIPLDNVNERYHYGELRLHRLNVVYNVFRRSPWYYNIHRDYQSWFSYELGFMLVIFAYASVAMSAMQVMLTTPLPSWEVSAVCYWVSVVTTLSVVAVLAWQFFAFSMAFILNFVRALP